MKLVRLLVLGILIYLGASLEASAQNIEDRKMVCMMQDSLQVKPGIPIQHDGKTYYGCCEMCAAKVKSEPLRYTKAKDLVSKGIVDKADSFIFAHKGDIFYFQSAENREAFSKNPALYLP